MNYLIVSKGGYGFFMVPRLGQAIATEKVYFWTPESKLGNMGENLNEAPGWEKLEVVADFGTVLKDAKKDNLIVIIDDVGLGNMADYLMKEGWNVIGGCGFADKMEDDRVYSMELASKIMPVPEYTSFTSFSDAISFAKSKPKEERWVFKPNDAMVPKEYTYVPKNMSDLIETLEGFKSEWCWKEDFILQEFIDGVETDFGGFFNGEEWIQNSLTLYFENKPFLTGNVGPATGGAIAMQIYRPNKGYFMDILNKLTPLLKKIKYRGQFAINSKVWEKDKKAYFLEFTPRFGYPTLPMDITMLEDNDSGFPALIKALAEKSNPNIFPTDKVGVVLELSVPPYPNDDLTHMTKGQTVDWDKKWNSYFFPYFIKWDEKKKKIALNGYSGMFCHLTCADATLDGAVEMVYKQYIPTVRAKNLQYRVDLGKDARKRLEQIREWGLV